METTRRLNVIMLVTIVLGLFLCEVTKAGRILWDDSHDTNLDELNGNLSLFADAINNAGHILTELDGSPGAITSSSLSGFDALFIMDPELGLTSSEITAVQNFVDAGSGLFIAWDGGSHTSSLNTLLSPYGMSLAGVNNVHPRLLSNFVAHAVTEGIESVAWKYGSTINATGSAIDLIAGADPKVLAVAGAPHRVVVFGDASLFKNILIVQSDNRLLAVNIAEYTVPKPSIVVAVDIKPGSCPNPVNVKSSGVLPIAILGTVDYDITTIDPTSVAFSFGEISVGAIRSGYEDVAGPVSDSNDCNCITGGPDGFLDLTLKFKTQRMVEAIGDVNDGDILTLELTGVLYDPIPFETPIEGADCILIEGWHKAHNKADINKDGVVDMTDFAIISENWLQSSIVED